MKNTKKCHFEPFFGEKSLRLSIDRDRSQRFLRLVVINSLVFDTCRLRNDIKQCFFLVYNLDAIALNVLVYFVIPCSRYNKMLIIL